MPAMLALALVAGCASAPARRGSQRGRASADKITAGMQKANPGLRWGAVQKLTAEGLFDQAITAASRQLIGSPQDAYGYLYRGIAYFLKQDLDLAEADLTRAIALAPGLGEAHGHRALVRLARKDNSGALEDLTAAIERGVDRLVFQSTALQRTDLRSLYAERSWLHHELGRYDLALADINLALAIAPEAGFFYINRGNVYLTLGRLDKALADAQTCAGLLPQFPGCLDLLGLIRFYEGQYPEAIRHFTRAIEMAPRSGGEVAGEWAFLYGSRALAHWQSGARSVAIEDLKRFVGPANPAPKAFDYFHLAFFMHEEGQALQAQAYFKRAQDLDPGILQRRGALESRYGLHPKNRAFFEREMVTAALQLSGAAPAVSQAPAAGALLEIDALVVVPAQVSAGAPFDVELRYRVGDPSTRDAKVTAAFQFEIRQEARVLFRSEPAAIQGLNGQGSTWVQHMNPTSARGDYTVRAILTHKGRSAERTAAFSIR